jgi:N-acetylglucosaminyl-diphospho-decaprenol L-rhamnosyltransferase
VKTAVITIVAGRRSHLIRQHRGLSLSSREPDAYIVVAMDASTAEWTTEAAPHPVVVELPQRSSRLPLAAARNLGARRATEAGAELLVFLDVDCIPSPAMLEYYSAAAASAPDALLSGAVGYLPEGSTDVGTARFHSFRPRLPTGVIAAADPKLFWSLSFACTPAVWTRIGGFDETYNGYGGEDTDFAMRAERAGVAQLWVGGAEAFHQFHPTNDPPTQHLDDILRNGRLFAARWGFWPMEGWLHKFEGLGLVSRNPVTGDWGRAGMET